jgi:Flp pilus assembly protein TadG
MFMGLVEFGEAFSVNRKISNAASTVSDLISQENAVNNLALQDIATVASELIKPYRTAPLAMRVISVVADEQNATTVAWTYPVGAPPGTTPAIGAAYPLPQTALTEPNSSLIVTETYYAFTPSMGYFLGSITLNGIAYFRPRLVRTVTKTD